MGTLAVVGIKPADEEYKKKAAAWNACSDAGVPIPKEISEFFDYEEPLKEGMTTEVQSSEYSAEMTEGLVVDLSTVPKGVKLIRFTWTY